MAQAFSLFPASVPRIAIPNPHKKKPSLSRSIVSPDSAGKSPYGESVITQIDQVPMPPSPPRAEPTRTQHPPTGEIGQAITTTPYIDGPALSQPQQPTRQESPRVQTSPDPKSIASGSTLVQNSPSGNKDVSPKSPIVPIRSMFPTYNPGVPLHEQNYYPQRPYPVRISSIQRTVISREDYRSSLLAPPSIRTAPASIVSFPPDVLSLRQPRFSSSKELEKLWEATQGSEPSHTIKTFDLEMARYVP